MPIHIEATLGGLNLVKDTYISLNDPPPKEWRNRQYPEIAQCLLPVHVKNVSIEEARATPTMGLIAQAHQQIAELKSKAAAAAKEAEEIGKSADELDELLKARCGELAERLKREKAEQEEREQERRKQIELEEERARQQQAAAADARKKERTEKAATLCVRIGLDGSIEVFQKIALLLLEEEQFDVDRAAAAWNRVNPDVRQIVTVANVDLEAAKVALRNAGGSVPMAISNLVAGAN